MPPCSLVSGCLNCLMQSHDKKPESDPSMRARTYTHTLHADSVFIWKYEYYSLTLCTLPWYIVFIKNVGSNATSDIKETIGYLIDRVNYRDCHFLWKIFYFEDTFFLLVCKHANGIHQSCVWETNSKARWKQILCVPNDVKIFWIFFFKLWVSQNICWNT